MIAGDRDLIRQCAVTHLRDVWGSRNTVNAQLDMRFGICAHYIFIDGIRYIERLTRSPPKSEDVDFANNTDKNGNISWTQILSGGKPVAQIAAHVLEDHIGVRQVVFTDHKDHLSWIKHGNVREPWWRSIYFKEGENMRVWSDGLKLRFITSEIPGEDPVEFDTDDYALYDSPAECWSPGYRPRIPGTKARYPHLAHSDYYASMVCNEPDTFAYSALWCGTSLVRLHAHRHGEDRQALALMYADADRQFKRGFWVYFPVAEDELLDELFILAGEGGYTMHRLMFRTSHDRDMEIGPTNQGYKACNKEIFLYAHETNNPDAQSTSCQLMYCPVFSIVPFPYLLHYTVTGAGADMLALQYAPSSRPVPLFPPRSRISLPRHRCQHLQAVEYMALSVCLDNVVSVTPCYKQKCFCHPERVLCGLMLHYAGDREQLPKVLGEYRLDGVGQPIWLNNANALYFCFEKSKEGPSVEKSRPRLFFSMSRPRPR